MATARERHPQVFVERNDDPRQRKRTVPMEVLSLGYSRTGTMTMKAALEILGIPTWHWVTMSENTPDIPMWSEGIRAKFDPDSGLTPFGREQFDNLLGHCGACTDQPAVLFAGELVQAYPEAKIVLVERDVDRWYSSYSKAVIEGSNSPFIPFAEKIDSAFMAPVAYQTDLIAKYVFGVQERRARWLMNRPEFFAAWRRRAKEVYRAHNEMIKRVTPKDRLLVFNLSDGWEPLCRHLGRPIPDVPFPWVNETEAVKEKINLYIAESYRRSARKFLWRVVPFVPVAAALVAVAIWWWTASFCIESPGRLFGIVHGGL